MKGLAIRRRVVKAKQLLPAIVSIGVVSGIVCDLQTHLECLYPQCVQRFAIRALAFADQVPGALTKFSIRLLKEGRQGG